MHDRATVLGGLRSDPRVPVLILGGGINGVGLYRELALQGVDCLLVDKADFASGASSKSSRMIHGGLRYLETREVRLVRESLAERNRLIDNAPHYVAPLKTTIPLFSWLGGVIRSPLLFLGFNLSVGDRGAFVVKLGLAFYDFVTRKHRRTPTHYLTSKRKTLERIPGLHPDIVASATYWDACITEAERLCIELLADAEAANPNCHSLNYVAIEGTDGSAVTLRDEVTGETVAVEPQIVINATGAWVDKANAALGLDTGFMGGTKGSHLVVDHEGLKAALGDRMVYYQHADGRVCIAFAFRGQVIMGSTDLPVDDPDEARCDDGEIDYMLTTLRGVFPGIDVGREHVVYAFCGVRPLPAVDKAVAATITRGHSIRTLEPEGGRPYPILCLIGGKWTTFRAFAEQVADQLLDRLGQPRTCSTAQLPIGGGRAYPADEQAKAEWLAALAGRRGLSAERAAILLDRYGTSAEAYADDETPLTALPDYSLGEVRRLAGAESVVRLTDLLCRRTTLALLGRASAEAIDELAGIVGDALGWDEERRAAERGLALDEACFSRRPAQPDR